MAQSGRAVWQRRLLAGRRAVYVQYAVLAQRLPFRDDGKSRSPAGYQVPAAGALRRGMSGRVLRPAATLRLGAEGDTVKSRGRRLHRVPKGAAAWLGVAQVCARSNGSAAWERLLLGRA